MSKTLDMHSYIKLRDLENVICYALLSGYFNRKSEITL